MLAREERVLRIMMIVVVCADPGGGINIFLVCEAGAGRGSRGGRDGVAFGSVSLDVAMIAASRKRCCVENRRQQRRYITAMGVVEMRRGPCTA